MDTTRTLVLRFPAHPGPAGTARMLTLLDTAEPGLVVCDLAGLVRADLTVVDALARVRLTAGRRGHRVAVRGVGTELAAVFELVGLAGLLEAQAPGP
ncbi:STAS domain-containing protein [Streptomyces sp. NPDC090025]|uniref:STAS domain-containing protein n=1 Tax=Streptomyces sp. NPDC090025 TaxID=3365922 RepID=UPI0038390984